MSARPEDALDWLRPDYEAIYRARADRLARLRSDPALLALSKLHYADSPADFINDWGMTHDPRAPERGLPSLMPFVLFPRQRAWIDWAVERWHAADGGGLCDKSRDMGITWLAMALSCTLCLFHRGVTIGFGSRKEELVDKVGDPHTIFFKGRQFMKYLPPEYRNGYDERRHSPHMRLLFPATDSAITGEGGDNIGRGGRASIYFVDEAAFLERPKMVDASLSATTNCRIDMSSVNGSANSFAERRRKSGTSVFTFHYRDDPRKDADWLVKKKGGTDSTGKEHPGLEPVVFASEYDINYSASVEGVIIPSSWVEAAIDAHVKLGINPTGAKRGALDVADAGVDKNAMGVQHGVVFTFAQSWRGTADLDIFHTVERAFMIADEHGLESFKYDADGLGASVRGDARKVNEARELATPRGGKAPTKVVDPYRGSGAVFMPEQIVPGTERTAQDYFENFKAQAWHTTREKFKLTYRAVNGLAPDYNPSDIISISSTCPELNQLKLELSQPTWVPSKSGKWMVEKAPEGTLSPNVADTLVMLNAPMAGPIVINPDALAVFARR